MPPLIANNLFVSMLACVLMWIARARVCHMLPVVLRKNHGAKLPTTKRKRSSSVRHPRLVLLRG